MFGGEEGHATRIPNGLDLKSRNPIRFSCVVFGSTVRPFSTGVSVDVVFSPLPSQVSL